MKKRELKEQAKRERLERERRDKALEKEEIRQLEDQKRQIVKMQQKQNQLEKARSLAIDYHVSSNGRPRGTFENKGEALRAYRELRGTGIEVTLTRVRKGQLDIAVFHGKKFAGWETEDGRRISSLTPDFSAEEVRGSVVL